MRQVDGADGTNERTGALYHTQQSNYVQYELCEEMEKEKKRKFIVTTREWEKLAEAALRTDTHAHEQRLYIPSNPKYFAAKANQGCHRKIM